MNTHASAPASDAYQGYTEWKGWQGAFAVAPGEARNFAVEFRQLPLAGLRVLEIGFGEGRFMAWARAQGAMVEGTEINAEMLAAARAHGYPVRDTSLAELAGAGTCYDLIVAFDVLEHWDQQQLTANFHAITALLPPGGHFLARFPNGHSPFGRIYQHGDFTHQTALSCYKIDYLAMLSGLEVVRYANPARVPPTANPLRALRYRWRAWQRRRVERWVARLYGTPRLPLAPNLVVLLRKPAAGQPAKKFRYR